MEGTIEYPRCESSPRAPKGYRCKALLIPPPDLASGIFLQLIFETHARETCLISMEGLVEQTGFEPATYTLRTCRSPS
jgi:hypothetical protein